MSAASLIAHLKPCAVEVPFDGAWFVVPELTVVDWVRLLDLEVLDVYEIFPVLAGQEAIEAVEDALWEGRADHDVVRRVGLDVITAAGDRPWWVTLRLIATAAQAWDVVHVNDVAGRSLAGWLDELWSKVLIHVDPKKKAAWINEIESVPKGYETALDFNDEERAFMAAMKAVMA